MTATSIEFNAVRRALPGACSVSRQGLTGLERKDLSSHVLLVQSGIGPDKARLITQQILGSDSWDVIISSGFAGGLDSIPIGSLVVGNEVVLEQSVDCGTEADLQRIACHPDWVDLALNMQLMGPYLLQSGRFVTLDRVVTHAEQKKMLANHTGAMAVDMESGAIGQVAQQHGVPFLIVRAISDGINEDLPIDFNVFLRPCGWVGGVKQIVSTPRCWKDFWRLYRNSKQAELQLSRFFENFLASVSLSVSETGPLSQRL